MRFLCRNENRHLHVINKSYLYFSYSRHRNESINVQDTDSTRIIDATEMHVLISSAKSRASESSDITSKNNGYSSESLNSKVKANINEEARPMLSDSKGRFIINVHTNNSQVQKIDVA